MRHHSWQADPDPLSKLVGLGTDGREFERDVRPGIVYEIDIGSIHERRRESVLCIQEFLGRTDGPDRSEGFSELIFFQFSDDQPGQCVAPGLSGLGFLHMISRGRCVSHVTPSSASQFLVELVDVVRLEMCMKLC